MSCTWGQAAAFSSWQVTVDQLPAVGAADVWQSYADCVLPASGLVDVDVGVLNVSTAQFKPKKFSGFGVLTVGTLVTETVDKDSFLPISRASEELFFSLGSYLRGLRRETVEGENQSLLRWLDGAGTVLERAARFGRDDVDDGRVGWQWVLDPSETDAPVLPWLAQFVGGQVDVGAPVDVRRDQVSDSSALRRGSIDGIKRAVRATLTGSRSVIVSERFGDPYVYRIQTFFDETSDVAATGRAVQASKPAGLTVLFETVLSGSWGQVDVEFGVWQDVLDGFVDWNGVVEYA